MLPQLHRQEITIDNLLNALQSQNGLIAFAVGLVCCLIAFGISYLDQKQKTTLHIEKVHWPFLTHFISRMVFPVSALVMLIFAQMAWLYIYQYYSLVLLIYLALLFWLGIIRGFSALVRFALPNNKLQWLSEYFLSGLLWALFICWALDINQIIIGWMRSISFTVGSSKIDLWMIITAIIWVTITIMAALWIAKFIDMRIMEQTQIDLSLRIILSKISSIALVILAILIVLPIVGINLTVLSVFGGAIGVGIGFGLQKIASNYISGFIILLDRSISVGNRLIVDGHVGYITSITSRYTVLKGFDGSEALIPNEQLISNTVINQSYVDTAIRTDIPVQVAYGTDLELALDLLLQAADQTDVSRMNKPNAIVLAFADSGINLQLQYWVDDPRLSAANLQSKIMVAIWRNFRNAGVEMPFPQREIRILNDAEQE